MVLVGPHDFSQAAYHDGAFDLQNFLGWSEMIAHQETTRTLSGLWRMATTERRLRPALNGAPVTASARDLLGTRAPWFEGWLEHPDATDPFWAPLQCGAALQRTTVPTLLVGGWQDLFLAQTLEQYRVLSGRGVPTRLLVGPWTHLEVETKGATAIAEGLAWLDRHLAPRCGGRRGGRTGDRSTRSGCGWAARRRRAGATCPAGRPKVRASSAGTWARAAPWVRSRSAIRAPPSSATIRPIPPLRRRGGHDPHRGGA